MREILRDIVRLLTFRLGTDRFGAFGSRHLATGLALTWIAGVGRYWDSPRAHLFQYAGVGSLAYVCCLAALLWAVVKPMAHTPAFGFRNLLTFVCLTSPPALFYAIPVERFMPLAQAAATNAWFLAVVALWRVSLLLFYLRRAVGLGLGASIVGFLLPVSAIVMLLAALNLEQAAFEIMGGLREVDRTSADASYGIVVLMGLLSFPIFIVTFLLWAGICWVTWRRQSRHRVELDAGERASTRPVEPGVPAHYLSEPTDEKAPQRAE